MLFDSVNYSFQNQTSTLTPSDTVLEEPTAKIRRTSGEFTSVQENTSFLSEIEKRHKIAKLFKENGEAMREKQENALAIRLFQTGLNYSLGEIDLTIKLFRSLGLAYINNHQFQNAAQALQNGLELIPSYRSSEASALQDQLKLDLKNIESLQQEDEKVINRARLCLMSGNVALDGRNFDGAITKFQEGIQWNPCHEQLLTTLCIQLDYAQELKQIAGLLGESNEINESSSDDDFVPIADNSEPMSGDEISSNN